LGKNQIVRDYAKEKGWQFKYIAPAQFEEMGDLHGMTNVIENKMAGKMRNIKVRSPRNLNISLTGKCQATCHYRYNLPLVLILYL